MSVKTTAANGNWSATSTWTGATLPTPTDTVTITHAVTVDINVTTSGIETASTGALLMSPAGLCTVTVGYPRPMYKVGLMY